MQSQQVMLLQVTVRRVDCHDSFSSHAYTHRLVALTTGVGVLPQDASRLRLFNDELVAAETTGLPGATGAWRQAS